VIDLSIALLVAVAIVVAVRPLPITDQPILKTIIALRNLNLPIRRMLEVDGGWCFYLNPPCTPEWGVFEDLAPASDVIIDKKVDAIMVSDRFSNFLRARDDRSLASFSETPVEQNGIATTSRMAYISYTEKWASRFRASRLGFQVCCWIAIVPTPSALKQ
jgi:hypothetical protein